ncbi:MAG: isobutyryl-CoA mutase small subunit [Actinomycetota bacterium]|jgi:methylmalonyl-CoA mutase C-terminal domain/subunit|nr:isobutyryl-CoA mutase small subunit [Actinomycetota bacterium]
MVRPPRVVVAKVGLDGHDRGAKVVVRALRADGFDVVYAGLRQTPEAVADLVVRVEADAVGLSMLSGAHLVHFPRLVQALTERGAGDVVVFGGGIIPSADGDRLRASGVGALFGPGTALATITSWLRAELSRRRPVGRSHQAAG